MGGIRCTWASLCLAVGLSLAARGADAVVVFSDDFESGVSSIISRWGNATSISLTSDVPSSSTGRQSLQLNAGLGQSALLYHRLPTNYGRLFYRYYVKYEGTEYHHTGAMIGGYDPPTNYPQGDAGLKGVRPNGDKLLHVSFEPDVGPYRLDFYNNWIDMQGIDYQGQYYGRNLVQDLNLAIPSQWTCIELMVSLNTPVTATNGELAVWINGVEVTNFHPGAPNGYWDTFGSWRMNASSPPFSGFRWRDTTSLGLNWVKLQNYDATARVWFDDVVVATQRIGCLPEPALSGLACGVILLAALARRRFPEA